MRFLFWNTNGKHDINGIICGAIIEQKANIVILAEYKDVIEDLLRFLYKGIIIKHNKTEPTYTKTSLFLCEKRRFFMARTEKGVVATI